MRTVCHFLRSFDFNNSFPDNDTSSGTTATTAPGTQASTPSAVVDTAVTPLPVVAYSPIGQAATFPSVAVAAAKINVTQATQVDATPGVRVPAPTPDPLVLITQASGSNRWYCVSVGRQVGVFDSWCVSRSISPRPLIHQFTGRVFLLM